MVIVRIIRSTHTLCGQNSSFRCLVHITRNGTYSYDCGTMFHVVFFSPAVSVFFPFFSCSMECNDVELNACGHISLE